MSLYKPAKSRFYHYDFQYQGRRFHGSTGQEALRKAEAVERRKRQAAALGELARDDIPTLEQAASAWWTDVAKDLRTADDVWTRIGACLRLLGRATPLTEVDHDAIADAMRRRGRESYVRSKSKRARRYPVQPATVNADVFATMRRILNHAAKNTKLKPMLPAINWRELKLREPEAGLRLYTVAQREAWRGECEADNAAFALDLLLTYGLRFGELFFPPDAFHPAEPPEQPAFLLLDKRKRGLMVLPLRDRDARLVAARVSRAAAAGLSSIFYEQGRKGRLEDIGYDALYARLRGAAKRAGLTMGRVIHGARHHAGATIVQRTGNLKLAQQLLGHAQISSTVRYAHMMTRDLKDALEALPPSPGIVPDPASPGTRKPRRSRA